jgi:hypothetical protein
MPPAVPRSARIYLVNDTLGQADAVRMTSANYTIVGGFWALESVGHSLRSAGVAHRARHTRERSALVAFPVDQLCPAGKTPTSQIPPAGPTWRPPYPTMA